MDPHETPQAFTGRLDRVVVGIAAVAVVVLAGWALAPLFAPLLFAAWSAAILDSLAARISRLAGGRRSVGAAVCVVLLLSLFVPVGLLITSLVSSVVAFGQQLFASGAVPHALEVLVSPNGGAIEPTDQAQRWLDLARTHGMTAWQTARGVAGAGAWALVVLLVFFVSLFEFIRDGRAMWAWVEEHAPVSRATSARLAGAFLETGRGLIVGAGLTALMQAIVATVGYAILGVPRAMVLGAVTYICAFVPAVGTAAVWAPVAVGLAMQGQPTKAIILVAIGLLGVGTIDNIMRPLFQRWGGKLNLPAFWLLLAAFGGLAAFGAVGLVIGPLALRMARELLEIAREARAGAIVPPDGQS
ncbi:MAG: AI-2E family transporter [Myxococcales bacterium]|nr:AI-2E family transporter [Myxococcales bacterium]